MMPQSVDEARRYLGGAALQFDDAYTLSRQLKSENEISLARSVLARMRSDQGLLDGVPSVSLTTWDARRRVTIYDLNLALFMNKAARAVLGQD